MGACCGGAKSATDTATRVSNMELAKPLQIHGDLIDYNLRTIIVCLKLCGIKHNLSSIDTLAGEHLSEEYLELNPTG